MKRSIIYFLKYFLFWLIYFVAFKVLFLLYNLDHTVTLGWKDILGAFFYGLRMDLSAAGYFTGFTGLLLALSPLFKGAIIEKLIRWYTLIVLIAVTFLGILDFGLFHAWGCRLNGQILLYLGNPKEMLACLAWWQYLVIIVAEVGVVWGAFRMFKRLFPIREDNRHPPLKQIPVLLLLTGALILPIRSGINTSPLNFSSVYFSENLYANQCAYNYFWSFSYALLNNTTNSNPVHYMDAEAVATVMNDVSPLSQRNVPSYIHSKNGRPVNVILVILESFSNKVIEPLGGLPDITPRLNAFCREGLLFSSFYSTGNRSDKGISSLLASYPALLKSSSVLLFPDKMKKLDLLPVYFSDKGYDLSFYYAGDIDFYNQRMLIIQSKVKTIVTRTQFPLRIATMQKWGAPDEYLYDRVLKGLQGVAQPYFSMIYTVSSHEPFDVPHFERYPGEGSREKYLNGVAYADSCLGQFIDKLKSGPDWDNTLVVITSDHTSLEPGPTTVEDPATYRVPMLWIGGAVDSAKMVNNICMQTDLTPTLVQQMGWKPNVSYFAKNIFGSRHYAFYYRDAAWGFLSPEMGCYFDLETGRQRFFYGSDAAKKDSLMHFAKGFTQFLHNDFQKR